MSSSVKSESPAVLFAATRVNAQSRAILRSADSERVSLQCTLYCCIAVSRVQYIENIVHCISKDALLPCIASNNLSRHSSMLSYGGRSICERHVNGRPVTSCKPSHSNHSRRTKKKQVCASGSASRSPCFEIVNEIFSPVLWSNQSPRGSRARPQANLISAVLSSSENPRTTSQKIDIVTSVGRYLS
jgi:hypothetical protein